LPLRRLRRFLRLHFPGASERQAQHCQVKNESGGCPRPKLHFRIGQQVYPAQKVTGFRPRSGRRQQQFAQIHGKCVNELPDIRPGSKNFLDIPERSGYVAGLQSLVEPFNGFLGHKPQNRGDRLFINGPCTYSTGTGISTSIGTSSTSSNPGTDPSSISPGNNPGTNAAIRAGIGVDVSNTLFKQAEGITHAPFGVTG
jgi:hypothetical protein